MLFRSRRFIVGFGGGSTGTAAIIGSETVMEADGGNNEDEVDMVVAASGERVGDLSGGIVVIDIVMAASVVF